jgi:hypothetical protein
LEINPALDGSPEQKLSGVLQISDAALQCLQLFLLAGNLPFLEYHGDKRPLTFIMVASSFGKRPNVDSSREKAISLSSESSLISLQPSEVALLLVLMKDFCAFFARCTNQQQATGQVYSKVILQHDPRHNADASDFFKDTLLSCYNYFRQNNLHGCPIFC